ncbi:TPA: hypothetical protein ACGW3M_000976 [Pseudomonas aeruginosa]|nr:hypothetical protein [Pseudomonas aeruginosa]ELJ2276206.1 hypothetical protein [Pseudomonas aeruginosa]
MNAQIKAITNIAQNFRSALEALATQGMLHNDFSDFPSGCCGCSSIALGVHINDKLGLSVEYVNAMRGHQSHGWLEHDGILIDITADQFGDRPPVYVGPRDDWYSKWEIDEPLRHRAIIQVPEERQMLDSVLFHLGLANEAQEG